MREPLTLTFLADWQVASGLGDGHLADAALVRDHNGLPVIPGRALKGALREGAWRLALCRPDLEAAETFFWGGNSINVDSNRQGHLFVSPAELELGVRSALLHCPAETREQFVRDLTCKRMQTALTPERQVKPQSLRTMECGIPGTVFVAELEILAPEVDKQWIRQYFRAVCAAVKSMGGNRARGLGACRISMSDTHGTVRLPSECPSAILERNV